MAYVDTSTARRITGAPVIRRISVGDLGSALRAGFRDFSAMPTFAVFLVIIYPVIGLVIARVTMGEDLLPLAYPLIAGFALLGPFAALGLYELSRRRERGLDIGLGHAFDVARSPSLPSIAALGVLQMALFLAWIATANALYTGLFGSARPQTIAALFHMALATKSGWALIVLGNGIGFVFAAVALSLSVVSLLLLLDRPVGAAAALTTSVRAVVANPVPMAIWGLIVAVSLAAGCATLFIGLALVLPILGHATWHLYRKVVLPVSGQL